MDIQIQRAKFEELECVSDLLEFVLYSHAQNKYFIREVGMSEQKLYWLNGFWDGWQQAQKVAVPDGYKLVSLKDLNAVYDELAHTHNPNYSLVFYLLNRMIEAQENST